MSNKFIKMRLAGIQQQLMGTFQASRLMSSSTKGSEREFFVDLFLSNVLPIPYRFGSGDITDTYSNKSGQIDVVVENPFLPSFPTLGSKNSRLYLVEGVSCAIEVKSNLQNQWNEVRKTLEKVKNLRKEPLTYSKKGSNGTTNFSSKGDKTLIHSLHYSPDGTKENTSENLLASLYVPFFAVGFEGWKTLPSMRKHCDQSQIDGILCIDNMLYVSGSRFGSQDYEGESALWHFICDLLTVTKELQALEAKLSLYVAN